MSIKAYASMAAKKPVEKFTYEPKKLGSKDIEINITHCGICHSDVHLIDNDWGFSSYPLVPGHEIVGTVSALGSDVKTLEIGQRVGVGWQSGSCLECEWCSTGNENLCKESSATCVGNYGGFAEKIIVDSRFAFKIPDRLESENAAPLLCGGITVYSPLRIFDVKPFHKVGVIGIGGLGHLAIQFANAMGCEVTAFSSTQNKEQEAKQLGAQHFINSKDENQLKAAAESLDFIISTVYADLNWIDYVNILRPNGKLTFVGASTGAINVPSIMLLMGQKSITGSNIGGRARINEMLRFAAQHNIKAKTELLPMEKVNEGLDKVRKSAARYRVVLKN